MTSTTTKKLIRFTPDRLIAAISYHITDAGYSVDPVSVTATLERLKGLSPPLCLPKKWRELDDLQRLRWLFFNGKIDVDVDPLTQTVKLTEPSTQWVFRWGDQEDQSAFMPTPLPDNWGSD